MVDEASLAGGVGEVEVGTGRKAEGRLGVDDVEGDLAGVLTPLEVGDGARGGEHGVLKGGDALEAGERRGGEGGPSAIVMGEDFDAGPDVDPQVQGLGIVLGGVRVGRGM